MAIFCRRFGANYRSHFQGQPEDWTEMGPIGFPETSARNYHYALRDNPEERNSHLLRGRSLWSNTIAVISNTFTLFSSIVWDVVQRQCVVSYRRLGSLLEKSVRDCPLTGKIPAHNIIQLEAKAWNLVYFHFIWRRYQCSKLVHVQIMKT